MTEKVKLLTYTNHLSKTKKNSSLLTERMFCFLLLLLSLRHCGNLSIADSEKQELSVIYYLITLVI